MHKKSRDVCEAVCFNKKKVASIKKSLIPDAEINTLSDIFKVLGDTTRVKILLALADEELCVCDIANVIGLSLSAISHQLRLLRNLRLVKYRNEGKMVFYPLDDEHITRLIKEGIEHIRE